MMKNDEKMIKQMKKMKKKKKQLEENCNFQKNEKLQFSLSFFHLFSCFFIFLFLFYHSSSFLLPVVQTFSEK